MSTSIKYSVDDAIIYPVFNTTQLGVIVSTYGGDEGHIIVRSTYGSTSYTNASEVRLATDDEILEEYKNSSYWKLPKPPLIGAPIEYYPNFIKLDGAQITSYKESLGLKNYGNAPRLEAWMNDYGLPYTYGSWDFARTYERQEWDVVTELIRQTLNLKFGTKYDCCFVNYYRNEQDHLGWHADDSPEMDMNHPIAVVSFGMPREIWLRRNGNKLADKKILLDSCSLFVMKAGMQKAWQHRIPKGSRKCEPRISLTFRKMVL